MKLATPDMIPKIDKYAKDVLKTEPKLLMKRSAEALNAAITENYPDAVIMLILAGKGNNGGDGYALAAISNIPEIVICDIFSAGQRTEEGRFWLKAADEKGIKIIKGESHGLYNIISKADVIVDAIFGTGFSGDVPPELLPLVNEVNNSKAKKIAVDVPLGVNAGDGSVSKCLIPADITVTLSYPKPGLLSYPARGVVGRLVHSDLNLPKEEIEKAFAFFDYYVDDAEARELLPERKTNSNKGSFGKTLIITGSDKYRGAAHLTLMAALRGGAGIVSFAGDRELCRELRMKFPEAIYREVTITEKEKILSVAENCTSVLIGSGSSVSHELCTLVTYLLENTEAQLVLDADALNSVSEYSSPEVFKKAKVKPIITPHPKELSRLSGIPVGEIEKRRLGFAKEFAEKYGCILLLKGAATIITDGKMTYINGSGNSALAKGGSGDTLAGLIASLTAFASSPIEVTALAAFVHGKAGENLSKELSSFGTTPSDLPHEMAKILAEIEQSI